MSTKNSENNKLSTPNLEILDNISPSLSSREKWQLPLPETFYEKLVRKSKEEPLVPIGIGLTTLALVGGLTSFGMNKRHLYQRFMWSRIAAQGATVGILIYGAYSKFSSPITSNIQQTSYLNKIQEDKE